jgi:hypothetical protein
MLGRRVTSRVFLKVVYVLLLAAGGVNIWVGVSA